MTTETKIEKLRAERDVHIEKARKHTDAAKELEGKITDLENTSIIGMVRQSGLTPAELLELIELFKESPVKAVNERTTSEDEDE